MFYYLSFLRPPPSHAHPHKPVVIIPQITNDLRTEFFLEEVEIAYKWIPSKLLDEPNRKTEALRSSLFREGKLTTWRVENAYKEVSIPPPQVTLDGQSFSLMLLKFRGGINSFFIDLHHHETGEEVVPVLSMPITFTSRPFSSTKQSNKDTRQTRSSSATHSSLSVGANAAKQDQIERCICFADFMTPSLMLIREHLSFDLDKKLWDSGVGLSMWLHNFIRRGDTKSEFYQRVSSGEHCRIIELGAGTGVVSLVLAALLSNIIHKEAEIVTTDLPSAMELIEHNISSNQELFTLVKPKSAVLDWDEEILGPEFQPGFDVIIMADVTYNTASFPSLIGTLQRLIALRIKDNDDNNASNSDNDNKSNETENDKRSLPYVLLAYKERDPAERTLWDKAREIGIEFTQVGKVADARGAPVEIYAGKINR